MIPEHSVVRLRTGDVVAVDHSLTEAGWQPRPGEEGAIVHVYPESGVYEMEICDAEGATRALVTVREDQVELVWSP